VIRGAWCAIAIAIAVTACAAASPKNTTLPNSTRPEWGPPQPGDRAPDFELPRTGASGTLRLSSLRGSWVLLHFTASWCPFCDAEVGNLGKLGDRFAPRGVKVLLVDVKESLDHWTAYAKAHVAPSVTALHDLTGDAAKTFAPPGAQPSFTDRADVVLDATLIIDPDGVVRAFTLPDSAHFDPTFAAIASELDRLLGGGTTATARVAPEPVVPKDGIVVKISPLSPAGGEPGVRSELRIGLDIDDGFHIMSNDPSKTTYIATAVALEPVDGVTFSPPIFPSPTMFALGPNESIRTFVGSVEVRVLFDIAPSAVPGVRNVHGTVRYQACTAGNCLFPKTLPFDAKIEIATPHS
jgi:peroxiredoxin